MAIITISRQVGSFGDEIGALAAEKLNYELITRELIHQEAQACDLDFKKACQAYEQETKPGGFFERLFFGEPAYTPLFESMNYDLAMRGNVVMLGRGANFALALVPGVLKVRVVAPAELRAQRIAQKRGVPLNEAADFVDSYGHRRRALIESIYQRNISDWANYDLIINTNDFSAEDGAEIVVTAATKRHAVVDVEAQKKVLTDLAFAKRVERAVKREITTLTYRDVKVEVGQGGQVTLTGLVSDRRNREKAEEIAAKVEGVTGVDNQLRTTELSF
jgi:cytidylate kinase